MSTQARKRLVNDFKRLQQDPPIGVNASPDPNNIMQWTAIIFGPEDTCWDGGVFRLTIEFSEEYPNKPPKVKFVTKLFHPNVYADGSICLDILQNKWSPIYDVSGILTSIQSLLSDPNPNSPANTEAARLFSENRREYNRMVKECVEQSLIEAADAFSDMEGEDGEGDGSGGDGDEGEEKGDAPAGGSKAGAGQGQGTHVAVPVAE